jgi:ABC-type branched-subunit amino acid transport system substrate-binding protein
MRLQVCVLGIILSLGTGVAGAQSPKAAAQAAGRGAETMPPELKALIDPDTAEVLKRINSLSPYETPDLRLRQDTVYANTPVDYEPFGAIKPYKEHFLKQMEYTGPGRAIPEPGLDLKSVKIGFTGPIMSTVSVATGGKSHEEALGIKMLQGVKLAIEEWNARGGYFRRHIPFEMDTRNDNGHWGASGSEIINMAYKNQDWAILRTIDGANSHIAIRVALKAETVMMNTGDTDPTFIETNIPWVMRCIGDDRQMGYLLMDYVLRKMNYSRIGIIRASNRYGRFGVREINDSARRMQHPVLIEMAYRVGGTDFSLQLERMKAANLDAVIHWCDAAEGALVLNQMRKMGMNQPFFASDRSVSPDFVKTAGVNADGVICGYPWNPDHKDPKLDQFRAAFRKRYNAEPDTYAAHAYDGMNMLIWAIQVAGLNRAKIRDVLAYRTKPWPGVTHDIPFGASLDDLGGVPGEVRERRLALPFARGPEHPSRLYPGARPGEPGDRCDRPHEATSAKVKPYA